MTFSTTWAIGGDADLDEGISRVLAHFAVGARTGPLGLLSCRVLPLDVPGAGFQVMPGPWATPVPGKPYQKYIGEITERDITEGLAGPGSSGGRHDLVVIRTDDPNIPGPGANLPADPVRGPYSYIEVLQGVPNGTKTFEELGLLYSGEELARIEYPPSTNTITGGMIKDLRPGATDANPNKDPVGTSPSPQSQMVHRFMQASSTSDLPPSRTTYWPLPGATFNVTIPPWATYFTDRAGMENAQLLGGSVRGDARFKVGPSNATNPTEFDENYTGSASSADVPIGGNYSVQPELRGKTLAFTFETRMFAGSTGTLRFKPGSFFELFLYFQAGTALQ